MMDVTYEKAKAMILEALEYLELLCEDTRPIEIYSTKYSDRWVVEVGGEYFGIYDTTRKTFVD